MKRILFVLSVLILASCSQKNYIIGVSNSEFPELGDSVAFINQKGDTIIPFGKYSTTYSFDTIFDIGFVTKKEVGIMAINNKGKELFQVFYFDNGPDYISDGLFRILENGKIGYANKKGEVIIKPQYDCGSPFEKGIAKVSYKCKEVKVGEHDMWKSENWIYINKKNIKIEQ